MNDTPYAVPKPRSPWPKRLKRAAMVLGPLAVVGFLLCTVGWPWVNEQARAYARARMISAMEDSAERLPQITNYEALLQQEITGENGWPQIERACRACAGLSKARADDPDHLFDTHWSGSVFDASDGFESGVPNSELGRIPYSRLDSVLADTQALADIAPQIETCGCLVPSVDGWWADRVTRVYADDYLGLLATRICALAILERHERCRQEAMILLNLLSKLTIRHSKEVTRQVLLIRNRVLEHCFIPLLSRGVFSPEQRAAILAARWHIPSTDPQLWLNNAAETYRMLQQIAEDESLAVGATADDPKFPEMRLYSYPGYAQLMDVCTQNAIDARDGVLDLRNDEWLASYQDRFSHGYNPINGVVG